MSQLEVPFNVVSEEFQVEIDSSTIEKNLESEIHDTLHDISSKVKNSQKCSDFGSLASIISACLIYILLIAVFFILFLVLLNFANVSKIHLYRVLHRDSKTRTLFLAGDTTSKISFMYYLSDHFHFNIHFVLEPTVEEIRNAFTSTHIYVSLDKMKDEEMHELCLQMREKPDAVFVGGHLNAWEVIHHLKKCRKNPEFEVFHSEAPFEIWFFFASTIFAVTCIVCLSPLFLILILKRISQFYLNKVGKQFENETIQQYGSKGIEFIFNSKFSSPSIDIVFKNQVVMPRNSKVELELVANHERMNGSTSYGTVYTQINQ
eukprot:gene10438-2960_t